MAMAPTHTSISGAALLHRQAAVDRPCLAGHVVMPLSLARKFFNRQRYVAQMASWARLQGKRCEPRPFLKVSRIAGVDFVVLDIVPLIAEILAVITVRNLSPRP